MPKKALPKKGARQDDLTGLRKLGASRTAYRYEAPSRDILETFENRFPERD